MLKKRTFMGVTTETDEVAERDKMQVKAEEGRLTGRGYWAGLRATWSNMDVEDKTEEWRLLNAL